MSETQTQQPVPETKPITPETNPQPPTSPTPPTPPKKSILKLYIAAVVILAIIGVGVVYQLEKEGRSSTTFFSDIIGEQADNKVIATINGETISNSDLNTSIEQFNQVAVSQGVDITSTDVQAEIRAQALTVLINTTLLKQEAVERGLMVSDESVAERLEVIQAEIGGEAVLTARMEELGIDSARLAQDVKDEILIQLLLDEVFVDNEIAASEEEITALYDSAGGEAAGLPPFAEVKDQVQAEVIAAKEQEIIDAFLNDLKTESEIVTIGE